MTVTASRGIADLVGTLDTRCQPRTHEPDLVALDVDRPLKPGRGAHRRGHVGGLKIASSFHVGGPALVANWRPAAIASSSTKYTNPNTVAGAVRAATALGVWRVNVHASGG